MDVPMIEIGDGIGMISFMGDGKGKMTKVIEKTNEQQLSMITSTQRRRKTTDVRQRMGKNQHISQHDKKIKKKKSNADPSTFAHLTIIQ